jgi:glutamate dehydrogenase
MADETARPITDIAHAFTVARAVLNMPAIWQRIDALDGHIGGQLQLDLYVRAQEALAHVTRWFMREGIAAGGLDAAIATHAKGATDLTTLLAGELGAHADTIHEDEQQLVGADVPADLAADLARLSLLVDAPTITEAAANAGVVYAAAARVVLGLNERFHLRELIDAGRRIRATDAYDMMAVAGAEQALFDARRRIVIGILSSGASTLDDWSARHRDEINRVGQALGDLTAGPLTPSRLMVAATRLGDLARAGG